MKLKKTLLAITSLALVCGLAACSGNGKASSQTKAKGEEFTVGFDANFPPYGYKEGGEYVGFDLDLAAEVAKRNGWKLQKRPIDWDSKDMELKSGTIDCIWNGFTMNGREDNYTFSKPYVDNSIVFVTKTDSAIKTTADLKGKTVLVQADSSGLSALQDEKNKDLVASFKEMTQVPDYNNAFMTLQAGAADAVAVDIGVAQYQLEQRGKDKFQIMNPPFHTEQYAIGFKQGNQALRDQVQTTLDEMKKDGTFLNIAKKYQLEKSVIAD